MLKSLCEENLIVLANYGLMPEDLSTHSLRKGPATYAASGTTSAPTRVAICHRAGWTNGKIMDNYVKVQMEGDCFVGRTVSGLPVDSIKFATLPAHFITTDLKELTEINRYAEEQFGENVEGLDDNERNDSNLGELPASLVAIKQYLLASLVHHMDFLLANLHQNHPLRSTPLFIQQELYEYLKPKIYFGERQDDRSLAPTGIPSHINVLREIDKIDRNIKNFMESNIRSEVLAQQGDPSDPISQNSDGVAQPSYSANTAELAEIIRREISGLRGEIRGEISGLRGEISGLRGEISGLRGEVLRLERMIVPSRAVPYPHAQDESTEVEDGRRGSEEVNAAEDRILQVILY
jgi:hypothetical protein